MTDAGHKNEIAGEIPASDAEVQGLANAINAMLARMEARGLEAERRKYARRIKRQAKKAVA